ncbi:hypothetical protein HK405_011232 [Cladochytrium tenue]|nr:hypothetical protein HK405_011232 [Cladochytrium tenue]
MKRIIQVEQPHLLDAQEGGLHLVEQSLEAVERLDETGAAASALVQSVPEVLRGGLEAGTAHQAHLPPQAQDQHHRVAVVLDPPRKVQGQLETAVAAAPAEVEERVAAVAVSTSRTVSGLLVGSYQVVKITVSIPALLDMHCPKLHKGLETRQSRVGVHSFVDMGED